MKRAPISPSRTASFPLSFLAAGESRLHGGLQGSTNPHFIHDDNGNLTSDGSGTYTYTPTNMLETAALTGVVYSYRYDGDNQRVLKIEGSGTDTTYYLRGVGDVLSEFKAGSTFPTWSVDYVYAVWRLLAMELASYHRPRGDTPTPGRRSRCT